MKLYVGNLNTLTWTGRELTGITMPSSQTMSYKYNSDGIRTQKTFTDNAVKYYYTHDYIVDGANIVAETINYVTYTGINTTEVLYYYYDESGAPTGIKHNGNVYYFQKNLQGDIIRILNSYGSIVATYTYDAWGNIIASTDTSGVSIGTKNPFRYRGYYYDTETGLYYLNSRYYDPQVGRFLNADIILGANGDLLSYNLFSYCSNNPIRYIDPSGKGIGIVLLLTACVFLFSSCSSLTGEVDKSQSVTQGRGFDTYDEALEYACLHLYSQAWPNGGLNTAEAPEYGIFIYKYGETHDDKRFFVTNHYRSESCENINSTFEEHKGLFPDETYYDFVIVAQGHTHNRASNESTNIFSPGDVGVANYYWDKYGRSIKFFAVEQGGNIYYLNQGATDSYRAQTMLDILIEYNPFTGKASIGYH